jgi:phage terminase large subunit GpA-like protein
MTRFDPFVTRSRTKVANEMHDTFLYASAAAIKYGVNWISDQGWRNFAPNSRPRRPAFKRTFVANDRTTQATWIVPTTMATSIAEARPV